MEVGMKKLFVTAAALAAIAGLSGASFAQASASASVLGAGVVVQEPVTAQQLAALIQTAIDALPEDATQEEIEAAIAAVLASSGASVAVIAVALSIVETNNGDSPLVTGAISAVAEEAPEGPAPAEGQSAAELAATIQEVIDALPANASEAQLQTAITAVVARSGSSLPDIGAALATIASNNAGNPALGSALASVSSSAQDGAFVTGGGGETGGDGVPGGSTGGGNSDY